MFGYSILNKLFVNVFLTTFVKSIYHSVTMKPATDGGIKPAASVDGRIVYVGIDDTKGFYCYCRQTGAAEIQKEVRLGGCNGKMTRFSVPHRIVFYHATEKRDHETILGKLVKAVMKTSRVKITRVHSVPEQLLQQEQPTGRFTFKGKTFYQAIDFSVLLDLQTDTCEQEITCEGIPNPFCGVT